MIRTQAAASAVRRIMEVLGIGPRSCLPVEEALLSFKWYREGNLVKQLLHGFVVDLLLSADGSS